MLLCVRPEHLEVKRCVEELNCAKEKVLIGGKVLRISPLPAHYRIMVQAECGCLRALANESQFAAMGLREGDDVVVGVSPAAIHVIASQAGRDDEGYR